MEQAHKRAGVRQNNRVYAPLVVMWLLLVQRLQGGAPLEAVVLELLRGLPASFWPRPCKRIRDWQAGGTGLSSHTGAYNQARQALPLSVVQQSCDRIFEELAVRLAPAGGSASVFVLDGSSMRMAHSPSLIERFALSSNQHGAGHWPVIRVLVAHDLRTGLGLPPEWGAMNGADAVSEQQLLEKLIGRLPSGAAVMGDRNFGVFSVAYAAEQTQHPVLLRLTVARAQRLAGGSLKGRMDRRVVWRPSRGDRRSHPDLPAGACVSGRLIVRQVQPGKGVEPFLLALFTTLSCPGRELVNLYGQRWKIETDLRTLKSELRLDQLTCLTPDMAAKEIHMGMAAYNLVRAVICLAAEQSALPPRDYGFTKARRIVQVFAPQIALAGNPGEARRLFDQMMQYMQQTKLPHRRRRRPACPRAVWSRGEKFPNRKT